jgi:SPP1 family predicted phage head-tail adaptor
MKRLPTSISSGALRHRIQIVAPAPTAQDASGGLSPQDRSQWSVVRECWANVEAWSGEAQLAANQFVSTATHWITIRHPRDFSPTSQNKVWFQDFTGRNRTFQIEAVLNPTETSKLLVLVCIEVNDSSN